MRADRRLRAIAFAAGMVLAVVSPALSHSGDQSALLQIDPNPVTAGGSVTLVGTNLEPNGDREITLAGQNLIVNFGTFKTDADGMLKVDLKIPSYLPAGVYEIRAAADEVLTVECDVQAAAGMPVTADASEMDVVPRSHGAVEVALLVSLVALSLALGAFFVWRTRHPGRGNDIPQPAGSGPSAA
jgi:hypothetical protein